ncbi:MAG: saccharopine dehydrogenase family protein [Frankiaceae bacterium]
MPDPVPATGTVHWVGTGLSTGSGLGLLAGDAQRVVLWGRRAERAEQHLAQLGLTGRCEVRGLDADDLAGELRPGDVVVSMLPATEHARLVRTCIAAGAHFACSSYVSPEIEQEAAAAAEAGLVVLTEAGLDPGLDHLLAHVLVSRGTAAMPGTATAALTSYCGGVPAVANEFRYRFSWAPLGVLTALLNPARFIEDGKERVVERPWEVTAHRRIGGEDFEAYPNRDSVPFIGQYGLPDRWDILEFARGTLRLDGWYDAWRPVFAELVTADRERLTELAADLAARYPMTGDDHDRVVLEVSLTLRSAGAGTWSGRYLLDMTGDDEESAMARCVSLPLAVAVLDVLSGRTPPGLHRATADPQVAERWLAALAQHGIRCELDETTGSEEPTALG